MVALGLVVFGETSYLSLWYKINYSSTISFFFFESALAYIDYSTISIRLLASGGFHPSNFNHFVPGSQFCSHNPLVNPFLKHIIQPCYNVFKFAVVLSIVSQRKPMNTGNYPKLLYC